VAVRHGKQEIPVARYRRVTVGSSHDDARPENSTHHTGAVRSHTGFDENLFFISPRTGHVLV
jgi:hypothetical protein